MLKLVFQLIHEMLKSFYELHFKKESLAHDRLDVIMHENNILWEVTTPKYTIYQKGI